MKTKQNLQDAMDHLAAAQQILKDLSLESGGPPENARQKIDALICLDCGTQHATASTLTRGLCKSTCYSRAYDKLRTHKISEAELISAGLLAPANKPGAKGKSPLALVSPATLPPSVSQKAQKPKSDRK